MRRSSKSKQKDADVNLLPLMNIIMLLIPFLILSTQFIQVGVLEVRTPNLCGAPCTIEGQKLPPKKPLNLTVSVTAKGLRILTRGNALTTRCTPVEGKASNTLFQRINGVYPWGPVRRCLEQLKAEFPYERQAILMAEPRIPFKKIVQLMDVVRTSDKKGDLFPDMMLSAGVL
jgi:biopolymer transport protein ExbD